MIENRKMDLKMPRRKQSHTETGGIRIKMERDVIEIEHVEHIDRLAE